MRSSASSAGSARRLRVRELRRARGLGLAGGVARHNSGANMRSCGLGGARRALVVDDVASLNSSSGSGSPAPPAAPCPPRAPCPRKVFAPVSSPSPAGGGSSGATSRASAPCAEPGAAGARGGGRSALLPGFWRERAHLREPLTSRSSRSRDGRAPRSSSVLGARTEFATPPLPYDYAALEPHRRVDDARHHLKHHQVHRLAQRRARQAARRPATSTSRRWASTAAAAPGRDRRGDAASAERRRRLRQRLLLPLDGARRRRRPQSERLSAALVASFGGSEAFRRIFCVAALEVFGSGWAWLVYPRRRRSR